MAVLSIPALLFFFSDNQKSIKRGENHYKSNHIETFVYDQNYIMGKVHASMKNKIYNVHHRNVETFSSQYYVASQISELFHLIKIELDLNDIKI